MQLIGKLNICLRASRLNLANARYIDDYVHAHVQIATHACEIDLPNLPVIKLLNLISKGIHIPGSF